jgi:hypothetical protein
MAILQEFFNVYCDESRVDNPDSAKMVIGALLIPRNEKKRIVNNIKSICSKYSFNYEIKWTKTRQKFANFYQELIDYFISNNSMQYRCIIVDKKKVDYSYYHQDDKELAFFKFYYFMLRGKLLDYKRYRIFLDKRPTRDKSRARALHAFLDSYILLHKQECSIEHLQAYHSRENILLQISDYLTGLVGYAANNPVNKSIKSQVAEYLRKKLQRNSLLVTSPLQEEKFNIFVWKGDHAKKG